MDAYSVAALLCVAVGLSLLVGHAFGYARGKGHRSDSRVAAARAWQWGYEEGRADARKREVHGTVQPISNPYTTGGKK